jgi:tetratricopeptide (TPR) repeat protein/transcriptional regulator with XRE-family HTH domain
MKSDSQPPVSTFPKILKSERERLGLSQQELAEKVNASPVSISNWERGKTVPGPYHRRLLSELFDRSLQELGLLQQDTEEAQIINLSLPPELQKTQETPGTDIVPRVWNIPYARNLYFTGREDVLETLRERLMSASAVALMQPQAISGLGGIGKTQTAVEYAYHHRDHYRVVLWVRADSRELLVSDFVNIATLLNLPGKNDEDPKRVVQIARHWLENHTQWLLILDNADDLEMTSEFLPSAGRGHTILTTRAQAVGTIAEAVELEKMDAAMGALFLLRRAKLLPNTATLEQASPAMQAEAKKIAGELDGLPLALDQAGAYIEETGCSLTDYLSHYRTRRSALLKRRGRLTTNHPESVATTWSLSFEKIEKASPVAAELLRLCAFLHPDVMPEEIISQGAASLGPILAPVVVDPIELNEAINELRRYSLVRRNAELKILNMHRLVQVVLKDRMDEITQRQWAIRIVRAVNTVLPEVMYETWPLYERYFHQAQVCIAFIEQDDLSFPEAARLLDLTGFYLEERGQFEQAEPLCLKALQMREQLFGPEHLDVAESLDHVAWLYHEQERYAEAEPLALRALEIRERALGPGHPDVARSLRTLAEIYHDWGNDDLAEPLYWQALKIREQAFGPDHPDVAQILKHLGSLYRQQHDYEKAEPLYLRALGICERTLRPDHPALADCLISLGTLYRRREEYEKAASLIGRALEIREKTLGPEHPEVAICLSSLGHLYRTLGEYERAEQLYLRAIAIAEKAFGPETSNVAEFVENLAMTYYAQERYQEAEPLLQRALALYERMLGPENSYTVKVRLWLMRLHQRQEVDQGDHP